MEKCFNMTIYGNSTPYCMTIIHVQIEFVNELIQHILARTREFSPTIMVALKLESASNEESENRI